MYFKNYIVYNKHIHHVLTKISKMKEAKFLCCHYEIHVAIVRLQNSFLTCGHGGGESGVAVHHKLCHLFNSIYFPLF